MAERKNRQETQSHKDKEVQQTSAKGEKMSQGEKVSRREWGKIIEKERGRWSVREREGERERERERERKKCGRRHCDPLI